MPIEIDGETYYTIAESIRYLGISRDTFYKRVKNRLQAYRYGVLQREYFRQSDLDQFREIRPVDEEE